jgi:hypothetical protein
MRLANVLLLSVAVCAVVVAAPDGVDEKPWSYPDGFYGQRDVIPEQEPNDTCPGQHMNCGDVINPGELVYADRDWYHFVLDAPAHVTIGTDEIPGQPTVDTYLELYDADCVTQIAYNDDGGPGLYSLIVIDLPSGEFNIMVRGYSDSSTGFYQCFLNCEEPPPPIENDTCEDAEANGYLIERCSAGSLQGNHSNAANDYNQGDNPNGSCTGYSSNGLDVVYYMDLNAGDVCDFVYTSFDCDGSFYILTDCADAGSCVIGADDTLGGDPESILGWTVPATGRYYLILDNWSSSCGGDWVLDYSIECGCDCGIETTEILYLGGNRCKYLFYGFTDCDVTNDFHLELLDPSVATLVGCSVPPESSWFCDIDGDVAHWWTDTNDVPPGELLPLMDIVLDVLDPSVPCIPFLARFTLDGVETCSTEYCFLTCLTTPTEETSWGRIKSMFK